MNCARCHGSYGLCLCALRVQKRPSSRTASSQPHTPRLAAISELGEEAAARDAAGALLAAQCYRLDVFEAATEQALAEVAERSATALGDTAVLEQLCA